MNFDGYKHNKLAWLFYNYVLKGSKFLFKHRFLYYLLLFTNGIFMTIIGLLISFILLLCRREPIKYYWIYYFKLFKYWGGVSLGLMFIKDKQSKLEYIGLHEFGHTFQNALLGPLFIFIVGLPSFIRYTYQNHCYKKGKSYKDYNAIWFEGSATKIGYEFKKYYDSKKEN